jgi:hypothetical protein
MSRIFNLFLAGLMLFVSVWTKAQVPVYKVEKTKTEQNTKKSTEKNTSTTMVSELSPMATVVPVVLDFQHDFYIPSSSPILPSEEIANVLIVVNKPPYQLSYFQNIFEKHIAIGAP